MADLRISDEVRARLGAEETARLTADPQLQAGPCVDCQESVDAAAEATSVVVVIPALEVGEVAVVRLAHALCAPSQVRRVPAQRTEEVTGAVQVTAGIIGGLLPRPMLVVGLARAATFAPGTGDRIDVVTSYLLGQGWQLCPRGYAQQPGPAPAGWRLQLVPVLANGPIVVRVLDPAGTELAAVDALMVPEHWLALAAAREEVSVYAGPRPLASQDDVAAAAAAGSLTGTVLPVEFPAVV